MKRKKCDCNEWINCIENWIRFEEEECLNIDEFDYCPWCGKKLKEIIDETNKKRTDTNNIRG